MATGTSYNPLSYPLEAGKIQGFGQGVSSSCVALSATNIDLDIVDDVILTGLQLLTYGISVGDWLELKVVATANKAVVAATPIPGPWYCAQSGDTVFDLAMPVKIVAGLTLRIVVHTTVALLSPVVAVNYRLWKVLV